jgi:hypothetical protein
MDPRFGAPVTWQCRRVTDRRTLGCSKVAFPTRHFRSSRKADRLDKERSESWKKEVLMESFSFLVGLSLGSHSAGCTQFQRWASVG